jgi:hypothetical protein
MRARRCFARTTTNRRARFGHGRIAMKIVAHITHHARFDLTDVLSLAGLIAIGHGLLTFVPVL